MEGEGMGEGGGGGTDGIGNPFGLSPSATSTATATHTILSTPASSMALPQGDIYEMGDGTKPINPSLATSETANKGEASSATLSNNNSSSNNNNSHDNSDTVQLWSNGRASMDMIETV